MVLQNWIRKFLSFFFKLLYHQLAGIYDLVAWIVSLGQWNEWIKTPLPYLGKRKILEIGFGPGHLQVSARQQGLNIFGLDLSPQMTKVAQKRMMRDGYQPKLSLGDGRALPFGNETFDQIIATFPAEYIFEAGTLAEVWRTLAPGGQMIVVPMAWITGRSLLHKFLGWVFNVTGLSVDKDMPPSETGKNVFKQAGFDLNSLIVNHKNSDVLVLIANKLN
jgi:ubiquinone/menaquinone biosynthesis C-methylase UbiE